MRAIARFSDDQEVGVREPMTTGCVGAFGRGVALVGPGVGVDGVGRCVAAGEVAAEVGAGAVVAGCAGACVGRAVAGAEAVAEAVADADSDAALRAASGALPSGCSLRDTADRLSATA